MSFYGVGFGDWLYLTLIRHLLRFEAIGLNLNVELAVADPLNGADYMSKIFKVLGHKYEATVPCFDEEYNRTTLDRFITSTPKLNPLFSLFCKYLGYMRR